VRRSITQQDSFLVALGEIVHDVRVNSGLSQQELADLVGVHRTYVSDIERGARNLTVTTVVRIANSLDISPSKLFRLVDDRVDANDPDAVGAHGRLEQ
jgi:transcriptional regulator with XRE-family HTH domain